MTPNKQTRDKVRAVFLAALMVVSVFGGTIALAGTAAATVTDSSFDSDTTVVGGASVTVSGDVDDDATDVQIYVDEDGDGSFDAGEGTTVDSAGFSGAFDADITAPESEGDYKVYVHQSDTQLSEGDAYSDISKVGTITVDNSGPTFSNAAPTGGTNTATDITVDITDNNGVNASTIEVTVSNESAEVLSSANTSDTAVGYSGGTLTVTPDSGDMPALSDGTTYTVEVSAEDIAGNSNSTEFSFTYDSIEPVFSEFSPEDGETVSLQNTGDISVRVEDANTSVEHITATLTSGTTEYTWDIDPEVAADDGISFSDNVLVISPGEGSVPALEEGTYDLEVTATDVAGNSNTTTDYSFHVKSYTPTANIDATGAGSLNDGDVTSEENVTLTASVSPGADEKILNDTVTLTIDGTTYDNTSDVYNNGTHTFTLGDDDLDAFDDGSHTVTVSGENELGYSVTETFTFTVDTEGPTVESVAVTDDEINVSDATENDEQVVVTFEDGDDVDASSISATVYVDGVSAETLDNGDFSRVDDTDSFEANLDLDKAAYGDDVENDSAVVNVTAATDTVDDGSANALTNADADASNTTFAIDTHAPNVVVATPSDATVPETVSGYVNLTSVVTTFEGASSDAPTYVVIYNPGTEDAEEVVIENPENLDTTTLLEGDHKLVLRASDDAGNSDTASRNIIVDNSEPTIEYVGPDAITGDVDVSELFEVSNAGTANINYAYEPSEKSAYGDLTKSGDITVDGSNTYTVGVQVADPGDGTPVEDTVTLDAYGSGDFVIETEENDNDAGKVNITIDSPVALSAFNVSWTDTDGFHHDASGTISDEQFTPVDVGTGVEYTAVVDAPRDGQFEFTLDNVTVEEQSQKFDPEGAVDSTTHEVDSGTPEVTDATVIDGYKDRLRVQAHFDEPVDSVNAGDISVEGVDADAIHVETDTESGVVKVTFDAEFQTDDAPELTFEDGAVTESYDTDGWTGNETSAAIHTITIDLSSEELNVISVPAESGSVDISESDLNSDAIVSVSEYDPNPEESEDWDMYSPDAEENSLTELEGGVAYVVNAEENVTVQFNVENAPAVNDRTSQDLDAGWNLIGHYQEGSQPVGQALAPLGDSTYSIEAGYSGDQLTTQERMQAGNGYWLWVDDSDEMHAPVNYGGMTSEKPTLFVPSGEDLTTDITNGDQVTVTVAVDSDAAIQTVRVSNHGLGIDGELKVANEQDVAGATIYTGTFDVDYAEWYDGQKTQLFVGAMTTDGNLGQLSGSESNVDPADRTGTVEITDADVSDTNTDGESVVDVDTTYDAGGFVSAELVVMNSDGEEVGSLSNPATDGSNQVPVQLSKLDDGEAITAKLIDADEDEMAVPNSMDTSQLAKDTAQVSGLSNLAYIENSPSVILGSGSDAIQEAVNTASAGETIYVEKGDYTAVTVTQSGVTLTAAPGVDQADAVIEADNSAKGSVTIPGVSASPDNVIVEGFTIKQGAANNAFTVETGGDQQTGLTVENNEIVVTQNDGIAVFAGNLADSSFSGNSITVADGVTAKELVYIGGEATYGAADASSNVNLTNNVFSGTVERLSQQNSARAGGNAIEFEADGDSEITGNNFTNVNTDIGVKVVYTNSTTTVEASSNEGLSTEEIHLIDGTITFEDANLVNNNQVNVTIGGMEYADNANVVITNSSDAVVYSGEVSADGTTQTITLDNPGDVSDGEDLTATLSVPSQFELDSDTVSAQTQA